MRRANRKQGFWRVALGMLQRLADGRYANTHETGLYLGRKKPTEIAGA